MKTGWIAGAVLVVLFGCHGTFAETCVITNRQTYNLAADTVNWSMRVGNGQNCRYGVRYAKVQFERMTLAAPPRSGRVVLEGSAFTYVPRKDFQCTGRLDNSHCRLCSVGDEIGGAGSSSCTGPNRG
jgi:hypothetical protein